VYKIFLTTIIICSGCAYTPINVPDIQPMQTVECKKPDPIPKTMLIEVTDGKIIRIDAGGETLIRNYAAMRSH